MTEETAGTPRTDAVRVALLGKDIHYYWHRYADLARQLEREVAALTAERERLGEMDALLMGSLPLGMCTEGPTHALRNLIGRAGALQAELDAAKRALAELVACKDLKDKIKLLDDPMNWKDPPGLAELQAAYAVRQPYAWKAARAALAAKSIEQEGK